MTLIHDNIDHGTVLWAKDHLVKLFSWDHGMPEHEASDKRIRFNGGKEDWTFPRKGIKLYLMEDVPTAENMARHFHGYLNDRIRIRSAGRAHLAQLDVYETPNCLARYPAVPEHEHPIPSFSTLYGPKVTPENIPKVSDEQVERTLREAKAGAALLGMVAGDLTDAGYRVGDAHPGTEEGSNG